MLRGAGLSPSENQTSTHTRPLSVCLLSEQERGRRHHQRPTPSPHHLDLCTTYVRLLFIDFSSAFNSIIPSKLINKLSVLGIDPLLRNWILDFLTNRPQHVRLDKLTSQTLILNAGLPQGCVLSPLLYSLFTDDCSPVHASNTIGKFADDTTVVGLISKNDESPYREEVRHLAE